MRTLFGTEASGQQGGGGVGGGSANVVVTFKVAGGDSTDALSWATGTYTPTTSGLLVLVAVAHSGSAALAQATSVAGSSITSSGIVGTQLLPTNTRRLDLWSAISTGTPGAITVTFPATNTGSSIAVHECTGVNTTVGTRGVIQNNSGTGSATTAFTLTLAAFASAQNSTFACWENGDGTTMTPKAGWTELREAVYATPAVGLETEWIVTNDTTPGGTAAISTQYAGIGVELSST